MNTNLKVKKKLFPHFEKMMMNQLEGGGLRYALNEEKEFTDVICEVVGFDWIGGNIMKYVGEVINAKKAGENPQEVNFVKIAVYAFIWYLKHYDTGFAQKDLGESTEEVKKK